MRSASKLLVCVLAVTLVRCSSDDDGSPPTNEGFTLTSAGGTLTLDGAEIVFPPNAVSSPQEITASVSSTPRVAAPSDRTLVTRVVSLLPHGFALAVPATVTLQRTSDDAGTLRAMRLADDTAAAWTDEGAATDVGNSVRFTIARFSDEAAMAITDAPTCTQDCDVCVPADCSGFACGSNGCDGTCGSPCTSGSVCSSGACVPTWTTETAPCGNQPGGTVNPMSGACGERPYRSAFTLPAGTSLTRAWTWRPPGALAFGNRSLYSPVIDTAGTLYVSNLESVWAVRDERTSARTIWQLSAADLGDANQGIVSPPVVVGNTVIVVTKEGKVHARNANDGTPKWTSAMGPATTLTYAPILPIVLEDRVVMRGANKLWAFALTDGSTLRDHDYVGSDNATDPSLRGSVFIGIDASSSYLAAYDATQNTSTALWQTYASSAQRASQPTFLANGTIVFLGFELGSGPTSGNKLYRVTPPSGGDPASTTGITLPYATPKFALSASDIALVTNGANPSGFQAHCLFDLREVNPSCTAVSPNTSKAVVTQPLALADGRFVIIDFEGTISVIGSNGVIGQTHTLATAVIPSYASSDSYYGAPIIGADGTLYVTYGGGGGQLHAVRSTP